MGKQLIIVGADFSAVAIGTAKVLDHITATISGNQYINMAPTGITVTAYWNDSSTSTVSNWTTSPSIWGNTIGSQTMTISYTRNGITKTTTITADVQESTGVMFTVTPNITNGTASSVSVAAGGTAFITVNPTTGYSSPTSATISSGIAGTVSVSGNVITVQNVQSNITISATCIINIPDIPTTHETFTLLASQATKDNDYIVNSTQTIGQPIQRSSGGTHGIYIWEIPAYTQVSVAMKSGGTYGMALTDMDDRVLEYWTNSSSENTTHICKIQWVPTKLYMSSTKFQSAEYTTQTVQDLNGQSLSISFNSLVPSYYINPSQQIGSDVVTTSMSSASYSISTILPANTIVTITCKETSSGGYGMALTDTNRKVVEYFNHTSTASTDNKHVCAKRTEPSYLYVSNNKFVSAILTFSFNT